jgi:DNA (cytosine-5)-methyltransferase 1
MSRPLLLDLFCGQGGAAMGYHRAGFDVVGVDIKLQPRYPFEFVQDDALEFLRGWVKEKDGVMRHHRRFAAIHASPPCQFHSALAVLHGDPAKRGHLNLIPQTRNLLAETGLPYVIENVPGAKRFLSDPGMLCGSMFDLKCEWNGQTGYLQRHRLFEMNFVKPSTPPCSHRAPTWGVYGHGQGGGDHRGRSLPADYARDIMGMPWASRDGVAQAIPPAYTDFIGQRLLHALEGAA